MNIHKAIFFLVLFFSFVQGHAQTIKEDRIDEEYGKCLQKDTAYANICDCAFVAFGKWNKEMDKTYDKLLRNLKKEKDRTALKAAQRAWVTYKEAEFNTYNNIYNLPGNKWCTLRQDGRIAIVKTRTLQLRQYLESVNSH